MIENIYTIYVGHYGWTNESKSDNKKLNNLGFNGYLFNIGEYYSLKVHVCYKENEANKIVELLKEHGLDAFLQVKKLKKELED